MKQQSCLFAGNRFHVLEAMLEHGLHVCAIFAMADSHLERALEQRGMAYTRIARKDQLCAALRNTTFDLLLSNGCPYLLPVSALQKTHQRFVNVHPSFLPDLKGMHPVNGALLFNRSAGASCHIMNDEADAGPLIARVEIPMTPDLDAGLLFRLAFMAEREVFLTALARDFAPDESLTAARGDLAHYTRKDADRMLDFHRDVQTIARCVRAFAVPGQWAQFAANGALFRVRDAEPLHNPYLLAHLADYRMREIVFCYDDTIIVRLQNGFLKLKGVQGEIERLTPGTIMP